MFYFVLNIYFYNFTLYFFYFFFFFFKKKKKKEKNYSIKLLFSISKEYFQNINDSNIWGK